MLSRQPARQIQALQDTALYKRPRSPIGRLIPQGHVLSYDRWEEAEQDFILVVLSDGSGAWFIRRNDWHALEES